MLREIKTVLLDAGGVILDESEHEFGIAETVSHVLNVVIPGYTIEDYLLDIEQAVRSFCPDAYSYVIWKHCSGDAALFDRLYSSFRSLWNGRAPKLRLSEGFVNEARAISQCYDIGIAGQYGHEILDLLEGASLLDCFTRRYTQDDFSITKPDPRYLEQIANACGVESQQCIMVGDRIDKDIIPAKQVGMKTVLIRTGIHKSQQPRVPYEIPDIELSSVVGLADAIQQLANRV